MSEPSNPGCGVYTARLLSACSSSFVLGLLGLLGNRDLDIGGC
ncbi:hypothetical protein [Streptomyces sp. NPDC054838]